MKTKNTKDTKKARNPLTVKTGPGQFTNKPLVNGVPWFIAQLGSSS